MYCNTHNFWDYPYLNCTTVLFENSFNTGLMGENQPATPSLSVTTDPGSGKC